MSLPKSILEYRRALWVAACEAQKTDPKSLFVVFADDNRAAKTYNNFSLAVSKAKETANRHGSSVLVYRATHRVNDISEEFGIAFTLPTWGERIGDRVYPSNSSQTGYDNGGE